MQSWEEMTHKTFLNQMVGKQGKIVRLHVVVILHEKKFIMQNIITNVVDSTTKNE